MKNIIKTLIGDKTRYRQFHKDVAQLPTPYAETLTAIEKYMWNFAKSDGIMDALEDILRMFQENTAENVPVKNVVGDDPVEFAETIMAQYPDALWLIKYRNQLRDKVTEAQSHESNRS